MLKSRTILHATDFSPRSMRTFELARSYARAADAELILLHVLPSVGDTVARRKAEQELNRLVKSDPTVAMWWTILAGDVADNILWMAKEVSADLIVLATRGKSGLPAWYSRSVSNNVARRARCAVMRLKVPAAWLVEPAEEVAACVHCDATNEAVGSRY